MFALFTSFADLITLSLLNLEQGTALQKALHFFIEDTVKIFVLLFIIVFFIGVLRGNLSPEKIKKFLEKKGIVPTHILAVFFGAVTPFCSCSSVPLFIGFIEAGIPLGATMSFLITSPMINEVAVILLFSLMGLEFTLIYIGIGLSVGLFGGLMIHRLRLEHLVEEYVYNIQSHALVFENQKRSWKQMITDNIRFGADQVKEIIGRIWPYVLVGIGLGAGLHGYVPQEAIAQYAGLSNPLAVPTAVVLGVPLYANVSATIPIAEALMHKAVPMGTVVAFMMSVSALSFPEMVILKKVLKPKMIGIFIAILIFSFILSGYALNYMFSA